MSVYRNIIKLGAIGAGALLLGMSMAETVTNMPANTSDGPWNINDLNYKESLTEKNYTNPSNLPVIEAGTVRINVNVEKKIDASVFLKGDLAQVENTGSVPIDVYFRGALILDYLNPGDSTVVNLFGHR